MMTDVKEELRLHSCKVEEGAALGPRRTVSLHVCGMRSVLSLLFLSVSLFALLCLFSLYEYREWMVETG